MAGRARSKAYKPALVCLAIGLVLVSGRMQEMLNRMRADTGLTRVEPLENAPPILAFTTVALGGFRGLIANVLWIRANDLQMDGKYFEMVQLADWITKLEPHFTQVWLVQSWNMAYNISVKFDAPKDRWRWVQSGIELLRDQGLRFNPKEALIYRELAWFFQHKMGQDMDDAHIYYKFQWAKLMTAVLGGARPDFSTLLDPKTPEDKQRVRTLADKYKMDPAAMQQVDERYGPLDWRLPESSAIYWAFVGLQKSNPKDLTTLRRVIYQSLQMATIRGRMWFVQTQEGEVLRMAPNLDLAEKASAAYLQMIAEDEAMRSSFQNAHKAFLRELVFLFYSYSRLTEADHWMAMLKQNYPDEVPAEFTTEEFALRRLAANLVNFNQSQMKGLIEALITQAYVSLATDDDAHSNGTLAMAKKLWENYEKRVQRTQQRLGLPPLGEMIQTARDRLLEPRAMDPMLQAQLRTKLGLPAPTNPSTSTNQPPATPQNP